MHNNQGKNDEIKKDLIVVKEDIIKNIGPCAGLYSGLIYAKNEDNFLIACDMPYFNQAYIDFLKEKSYEKILAYKNEKYFEPFFALYKKELANDLKEYIKKGGRSLNGFLREISVSYTHLTLPTSDLV